MTAVLSLALLLVFPAYALSRLAASVDWRILVAAPLVISLFTFLAYRSDKRRAEAGMWRIPESTLHAAELAGGWPGAFLAQRRFRHKTSKVSYQVVFWVIVLSYQFVAVDSLIGWRFTKQVLHLARHSQKETKATKKWPHEPGISLLASCETECVARWDMKWRPDHALC